MAGSRAGSPLLWAERPFPRYRLPFGAPLLLDRSGFDVSTELGQKPRKSRIRCPHCQWQPGRRSIWTCMPIGHPEYFRGGCGHAWNTFDTRGLCPGCSHQWLHTSCLSCGRWALHEAWYEREDADERGRL